MLGEERFELKLGKAQAPVRVAVTGRTVGPPLFEGLGPAGPRRDAAAAAGGTSEALTCSRTRWFRIGWKVALGVRGRPGPLRRGHVLPGLAGVPATTRPRRPAPSSSWAPPSTTASRPRSSRPGSTTAVSSTSRACPTSIVVTGGRQEGDEFSEAQAGALWLQEQGVPEEALRLEVQGRNSWESLAASARFLRGGRHRRRDDRVGPLPLQAPGGDRRRGRPRGLRLADRPRARSPVGPSCGPWCGRPRPCRSGGSLGYRRLMNLDDTVNNDERLTAGPVQPLPSTVPPIGGGVIGNTAGSGPVVEGSSPSPRAPAIASPGCRHKAPSSSGLGHHPLKVETRVRTPLGLPGCMRPPPERGGFSRLG